MQDTTQAILTSLAVPTGHQGYTLFTIIRAATMTALGRFNTPDARNSLGLFASIGFDPTSNWNFTIGTPPRIYSSQRVQSEIDGWLDVRHKIAHGAALPATRFVSGRTQEGPSLHRSDVERCIEFFENVVRVTAFEADQQFP